MARSINNKFYTNNKNALFNNISDANWNDYNWQLKNQITLPEKLAHFFKFDDADFGDFKKTSRIFRFAVTPYFLSLINFENKNDPLLLQIFPDEKELSKEPSLTIDPFSEEKRSPVKNLIKRYPDRAVVLATEKCASYCRYCTRKRNWKNSFTLSDEDLSNIVQYLRNNKNTREIVLSGGDALILSPEKLDRILSALYSVDSIEVVRIGTRTLSFLPQKIDRPLIETLKKYKPLWIITHFNHPNEFTSDTEKAIDLLLEAKVSLANQSVLLKNVNDNSDTMKSLLQTLEYCQIKPYYLFQCDLVEGTKHFRTSIEKGLDIMKDVRGNIGGLCIPTYVVDLPDGGKVPLLPEYLIKATSNNLIFKNYEGKMFNYPNL
ncbi:MAG TPA: KamA family radical SAM protein [Spirochaetota bacterium]|nr:KamA family radical SAM protein [Spirochaetota bacterium]HOS33881.1 KamA family radical SAM protein [Spirochaetota bacterium]HOS33896.1 KamA family radical SAM protein [Spirochaetota bacterium]HOS56866.1 KamA family radical SAM protein [Spirochaetota bacterium]HPK62190.1 KamA family radical SAM protein [Spirochaetota bacterium]